MTQRYECQGASFISYIFCRDWSVKRQLAAVTNNNIKGTTHQLAVQITIECHRPRNGHYLSAPGFIQHQAIAVKLKKSFGQWKLRERKMSGRGNGIAEEYLWKFDELPPRRED